MANPGIAVHEPHPEMAPEGPSPTISGIYNRRGMANPGIAVHEPRPEMALEGPSPTGTKNRERRGEQRRTK